MAAEAQTELASGRQDGVVNAFLSYSREEKVKVASLVEQPLSEGSAGLASRHRQGPCIALKAAVHSA